MSLSQSIDNFINVKKKKNVDRTLFSLTDVIDMLEDNFGVGNITIRSGNPAFPTQASIQLTSESTNNMIMIKYGLTGEVGNLVNFVVDDSIGTPNRPLTIENATTFDGDSGEFIILTLATDGSGQIANSNTWKAISELSSSEGYEIISSIGDEEEAFVGNFNGPLTGGQDGSIGNRGDMYFGQGDCYISVQESTATESYWKRISLVDEENQFNTQIITNTSEEPFMTLSEVGSEYGDIREINLITQGSVSNTDLKFGMFSGEHGQKIKLKWADNLGPATNSLTLSSGDYEGLPAIRDHTGSGRISGITFNNEAVGNGWIELEFEKRPNIDYWKLIGCSNGLRYTPKFTYGTQTLFVVFSEEEPNIVLEVGNCPHIHVEIYDDGQAVPHAHGLALQDGKFPRQRCYIRVVDVPMLSVDGSLTLYSDTYRMDGSPVLLEPPTFNANDAYLLLEWDEINNFWVVIESDQVTLIDVVAP